MLSLLRKRPWLSSVIATALLLAFLFLASLFVKIIGNLCGHDQYGHVTQCAKHHLGPFVLFWIIEIVDEHNGFVTAVATIVMAIFTGTLWFVTDHSVQLARDEFNASHRPRLAIREPRLIWPSTTAPAIINYVLENCGDSDARIVESALEHQLAPDPNLPLFTVLRRDIEETDLPAGTSVRLNHNTRSLTDERSMMPNRGGDTILYFVGRIAYEDVRGIRREMAFCRRFNTNVGRFCLIPGCEDEYGS